ncbi:hypothetical protein RIF29_45991 [Crotalaria pallida]|uniref:Uncharacterized protein n=1 Tax=Crotalaria pallida TaxID=3830 RepID=A0AAN9DTT5_CROPI
MSAILTSSIWNQMNRTEECKPTAGPNDPEKVVQAVNRVAETLPQLVGRYLPWVSKIPLDEGVTWEPTWKAIPNSPYLSQQLRFPTIESEL